MAHSAKRWRASALPGVGEVGDNVWLLVAV